MKKSRKGLTLLETLIVFAIIAVMIGLLLPAVQQVRTAALLLASKNNVKQICLGIHQHAEVKRGLLSRWSAMGFTDVLPYLEESNLLERMIASPDGTFSFRQPLAVFTNPLDPSFGTSSVLPSWLNASKVSASSYALNAQFFHDYPHMKKITDGTSHTIWLAEHYGWNCNGTTFLYSVTEYSHWKPFQPATFAQGGIIPRRPAPGDYYPITTSYPPVSTAAGGVTFQVRPAIDDCDPRLPNASSASGLQVGLADGGVRILAPSISAEVFWALVTPNRGEVVSFED